MAFVPITGMDTPAGRMKEMAYRAEQGPYAWCDRCDILGKKGSKCPRCHEKMDWEKKK